MAISRINKFKSGPWHEHSPQLYSIAHTVPKWSKINSGMLKMYDAEVLRKRVVVQHLVFSSLFPFELDPDLSNVIESPSSSLNTLTSTGNPSKRLSKPNNNNYIDTLLPPLKSRSERTNNNNNNNTLASSGSAAASSSPFGILSRPTTLPKRN